MKPIYRNLFILSFVILAGAGWAVMSPGIALQRNVRIGDPIDSLDGVYVYQNGSVSHTCGRNLSPDGYNLGLKYQCVEFAKRYYYEHYHHKMPDSYGHAKDFFRKDLTSGQRNQARNLIQFTNGVSTTPPQRGDLVVWDGTAFNPYGHIAVISEVTNREVEIIQQNPGPVAPSRIRPAMQQRDGKWRIVSGNLLGWLGKR